MEIFLIKKIRESHMGWSDLDKCTIYDSNPTISCEILDGFYLSKTEAKKHLPKDEHSHYISYKYEVFSIKSNIELHSKNEWIKIDKNHPLPKFEEVLAYSKEWVEADFNPKGVRIGYLADEGNFISAKYEPDGEDYISKYEEGDDYQFFQTMENGTKRTWYNNGDDRGDIEGYRPNLPTHYKRISIEDLK